MVPVSHLPSRESAEAVAVDRRTVVRALGTAALGSTAGCVRSARSVLGRDADEQIHLSIKTLPADDDPRATRIAQFLARNLRAVGVDTDVVPMSRETLYRDVLVNQRFDLYVGRYATSPDPDFLRPLLHSRYAAEPGWQNPFGFADLDLDRLLDQQRRRTGETRQSLLADVQRAVVRSQPFAPVAFADELRAVQPGAVAGWEGTDVHTPLGYLSLSVPTPNEALPDAQTEPMPPPAVRMTLTDTRALVNLNPLAAPFRQRGPVTGLLYDSLGRHIDGAVRTWLAAAWDWRDDDVLAVTLRPDATWHDGRPVTAQDVAFTYRFLDDTSLGRIEGGVPAPRFRGRSSLVADATAVDDRTVTLRFRAASRRVARRALTVPVLPEHLWADRAREATILGGIDANRTVTRALVASLRDPVGSGPLRVHDANLRESLTLEQHEGHFLESATADHLAPYHGGFEPAKLAFLRAPSSSTAVSMVDSGQVNATATDLPPTTVPEIARSDRVDLQSRTARTLYHVGFNTRHAPLSNPRFRQAVTRLVDRPYLVRTVLGDYGIPAVTPLARSESVPDLRWNGRPPALGFAGERGRLDVAQAERAFQRAGYWRGPDGSLRSA